MASKRGIAGSVLGSALLGILLVRGSAPAPPLPAAKSQVKPAPRAVSKASAQQSIKPATETAKDNTRTLKGPWIASQKHFAGQTAEPCPAQFNTIPAAKKDSTARGEGIGAEARTSVALEDGTVRVIRSGEERGIQNPRTQLWCIPDGAQVQAMIATAPDPVQTHMALMFDRIIEAIQMAAQSMGYVIDYYWLPWDIDLRSDWGDYDSLVAAAKDQKQRETQPGLLLFRLDGKRQDAKPTALYVFLVGETSTAGINDEQFTNAVEYIRQLGVETGRGCKTAPCIHIMGPTFSGSLDSLRRLLDVQEERRGESFVAKSGTISSQWAIENFRSKGKTPFQTFVRTIDEALPALLNNLVHDRDIDNPQKCDEGIPEVAILSELGTTFGGAVPAKKEKEEQEKTNLPCFDIFRYSREIAGLRNAYQDAAAPSPGAGGANPSERPWLSFNLTDRTNRGDEPPDFSKSQSPLSKEAVLMNFAAQIRRNHYRYIGISASNTLDQIFLVNFLRKAVPDARLFLFDPDLLLTRDLDNVPYIGTLAVTTYPLLDPNLEPVSRRARLPFSEHYELGSYNASVCTIAEVIGAKTSETRKLLYSFPASCQDPRADPSLLEKPPLWLTTVGTGGYWPVGILGPASGYWQPSLPKDLPGSWLTSATLLGGLVAVHFLVLIGISPFSTKFRDFTLGTVAPFHQLFVIHLTSATLALALVLVGTSTKLGRGVWAAALIVLLVSICFWLARKYILWRKAEAKKSAGDALKENTAAPGLPAAGQVLLRIGKTILIPGIWVLAGLLAYGWWELIADPSGYYGVFFAYRASHLASVVSPLTPMLPLLATIYLWAIFQAWRLRFNDAIRPRLNPSWESRDKRSGESKLRPGWRSEKRIAKAINGQFLTSAYDWSGVAIFTAWFIVFGLARPFEPFERPKFGYIYEFLFCVAILLILVNGFRLAQAWQELRYFLLELNRQPVHVVFTRLKVGWPSIWYYGSADADWDYMVRSDQTIQQLKKVSEGNQPLQIAEEVVSGALTEIRRTRRDMQDESFLQRVKHTFSSGMVDEKLEKLTRNSQEAQEYLAVTLNRVLDSLQDAWSAQPPWLEEDDNGKKPEDGTATVHSGKETDEVPGWQKLLEKYVALRYVAFIRAALAHIRRLLIFLAVSFSLVLISLVVYSFEPHRALIWSVTGIFALIGFIIVKVLVQVHRDPILSCITGTKANELGLTFYVRMAAFGAAPLLTLLATHFPSIGRYIVSFLQPGLDALK